MSDTDRLAALHRVQVWDGEGEMREFYVLAEHAPILADYLSDVTGNDVYDDPLPAGVTLDPPVRGDLPPSNPSLMGDIQRGRGQAEKIDWQDSPDIERHHFYDPDKCEGCRRIRDLAAKDAGVTLDPRPAPDVLARVTSWARRDERASIVIAVENLPGHDPDPGNPSREMDMSLVSRGAVLALVRDPRHDREDFVTLDPRPAPQPDQPHPFVPGVVLGGTLRCAVCTRAEHPAWTNEPTDPRPAPDAASDVERLALKLIAAIDDHDEANVWGWSRALRAALEARDD